ncbi:DUF397 domain-containing protein [Streptomyces thermolilacinus]
MNRKTSAAEPDELVWFKSSYSDTSNPNDCVEVAAAPGVVHVRDSKNVDGPRLAVARHSWCSFVAYASEG